MFIVAYFPTKRKEDFTMKDEAKKIKELKDKISDLEVELNESQFDLTSALAKLELIKIIASGVLSSKDITELLESAKKWYKKWMSLSSAELYKHNICTMAENLKKVYSQEAVSELSYTNSFMYGMLIDKKNSDLYFDGVELTDHMKAVKLEYMEKQQKKKGGVADE